MFHDLNPLVSASVCLFLNSSKKDELNELKIWVKIALGPGIFLPYGNKRDIQLLAEKLEKNIRDQTTVSSNNNPSSI